MTTEPKAQNSTIVGKERSLSVQIEERGITSGQWHTLARSLYPGAKIESVLMVIDYCRARGLDPMKKPCHIVPMEVKGPDGAYEWRDVVMPGIYEYRTTAQKTKEYMGHSVPVYGPVIDYKGLQVPESCSITVYRWNEPSKARAEFPVTVWFEEVAALKWDKDKGQYVPNSRWSRAPRQMLTKCTEAAALREAFPDELGGEHTFEEMEGQRAIDVNPEEPPFQMSKPAVTKIVKAMDAAVEKQDHASAYEIWQELTEAQQMYVEKQLDRWRRSEWKEAIMAGAALEQKADPNFIAPDSPIGESQPEEVS